MSVMAPVFPYSPRSQSLVLEDFEQRFKSLEEALAGVAQWIECQPAK